jgi:hypothetical protein
MEAFENTGYAECITQKHRQFFAETRLASHDWRQAFPLFIDHLLRAGGSTPVTGDGKVEFGEGRIWTRLVGGDLIIQVLAEDILTFLGIRTLVEGSLREISERRRLDFHWHPEAFAEPSSGALPKPTHL